MDHEQLKERNEAFLKALGIEVPTHLPLIEPLDEVEPRSSEDVASRLCAIAYVIGAGFGAPGSELLKYLEDYRLLESVSLIERRILESANPTEQEKINLTWLSECAQALAWSIGLAELDHFRHCDDDLASRIPFKHDPSEFIKGAKLGSVTEIQEQVDLHYRMHWYTRDCGLNGTECKLSDGIISERRKAIDWVYGVEKDWDEVPLDT